MILKTNLKAKFNK